MEAIHSSQIFFMFTFSSHYGQVLTGVSGCHLDDVFFECLRLGFVFPMILLNVGWYILVRILYLNHYTYLCQMESVNLPLPFSITAENDVWSTASLNIVWRQALLSVFSVYRISSATVSIGLFPGKSYRLAGFLNKRPKRISEPDKSAMIMSKTLLSKDFNYFSLSVPFFSIFSIYLNKKISDYRKRFPDSQDN